MPCSTFHMFGRKGAPAQRWCHWCGRGICKGSQGWTFLISGEFTDRTGTRITVRHHWSEFFAEYGAFKVSVPEVLSVHSLYLLVIPLYLHPLTRQALSIMYISSSATSHISRVMVAMRADEEQPSEIKAECMASVKMTPFTLIHHSDSRPVEPPYCPARIGLCCAAVCAHTHTHKHTQSIFGNIAKDIGPYQGELQSTRVFWALLSIRERNLDSLCSL